MTKTGKLSKRELETLNKAWEILSRWSEVKERKAERNGYEVDTDCLYNDAMNAVAGLCEFVNNYKGE